MTGSPGGAQSARAIGEAPAAYRTSWIYGSPQDYDRARCVDPVQLAAFLQETQPEAAAALSPDAGGPARNRFLDRLKREISSRGVIDALRKGIRHGPHEVTLFYGTPTPGNALAEERHRRNRFSVTRQLRYSETAGQLALDLALFINGLPVATIELKNRFTGQTVADAVEQYRQYPQSPGKTCSGPAVAPSTSLLTTKR